jgi:uncharacterized surface protein with fasciclin (FAS1) repeats
MTLLRLLTTAAAAATIVCPAVALAQASAPPASSAAPPAASAAPAAPAAPALPSIPKIAAGADIYDTLKADGHFVLLVKALDQSGLAGPLQKYPNITFFAPTDDALKALPPDVLDKLMASNDTAANQLQQILKYHIIGAVVDGPKIKGAKGPVATIEGQTVLIDGGNPDDLLVNNADIIQTDVKTGNGAVINVLDKVLIPPDSPYAAPAAAPASASTSAPATSPAGT